MGKNFVASARKKEGVPETEEELQRRAAANMMSALWNRGNARYSPQTLLGMLRTGNGNELVTAAELRRIKDPISVLSNYFRHYPNEQLQIVIPGDAKPHYLSRRLDENNQLMFTVSDNTVPEPEAPTKPTVVDWLKWLFSKEARAKISEWNKYRDAKKKYDKFAAQGQKGPVRNGKATTFELKDFPSETMNELHSSVLEKAPGERSEFEENYCETMGDNGLNSLGRYALHAKHKLEQTPVLPFNEDIKNFSNNLDNGPATRLFRIWCFNRAATESEIARMVDPNRPETIFANQQLRSEFIRQFADAENNSRLNVEAYKKYCTDHFGAQPNIYQSTGWEQMEQERREIREKTEAEARAREEQERIRQQEEAEARAREAEAQAKEEQERRQRHEAAMQNPNNEIEKMYRNVANKSEALKALGDKAMVAMKALEKDYGYKDTLKENIGMVGLDRSSGMAYQMGVIVSFRMACHNESARAALEKFGADTYIKSLVNLPAFKSQLDDDVGSVRVDLGELVSFKNDCGARLEQNMLHKMFETVKTNGANLTSDADHTEKGKESAVQHNDAQKKNGRSISI